MKRPSIVAGIVVALTVAVCAAPVWWGTRFLFSFEGGLRVSLSILHLAYLLYLLRMKGERVGTIILLTANIVAVAATTPLPLPAMIVVLAILVSLNRSLLAYRSIVSCGLDVLLSMCALLAAGYLNARTGSLAFALWGFFLLQSLWVLIPAKPTWRKKGDGQGPDVDPFVKGHRQAEAALQRLFEDDGF